MYFVIQFASELSFSLLNEDVRSNWNISIMYRDDKLRFMNCCTPRFLIDYAFYRYLTPQEPRRKEVHKKQETAKKSQMIAELLEIK